MSVVDLYEATMPKEHREDFLRWFERKAKEDGVDGALVDEIIEDVRRRCAA